MKQNTIARDEVRLTRRGEIATMPKRGFRGRRLRHRWGFTYIGYSPIEDLWHPLLRKLKVEMPKPRGWSPLTCTICDKQFFLAWHDRYPGHYLQPICSDACVAERRNVTRRRRRREYAEERQKVMSGRACVHCGTPLDANRDTKRYCSVRCRVAAYRAGRAEA